ncbi:hypothetical protein HDU76_006316 [Blyttiomyces sp. JEL0837]|nr:hypothetical protein HDU76_006316 [Blyttiomyces sp. JEL0837]
MTAVDPIDAILRTASEAAAAGSHKQSFTNFIKATNLILVRLASTIQWSDEDITSKPENVATLFRQAHNALLRTEEIVNARSKEEPPPTTAPQSTDINPIPGAPTVDLTHLLTKPTTSTSASVTTSNPPNQHQQQQGPPSKSIKNLPLIPLSPLTSSLQIHRRALQTHQKRYADALSTNNDDSEDSNSVSNLTRLRRLLEDFRIAEFKVTDLEAAILAGANAELGHWSCEGVALQITRMNCKLFAGVDVRRELGMEKRKVGVHGHGIGINGGHNMDTTTLTPGVKSCVDFARYLERVTVSLVLRAGNSPSSSSSSSSTRSPPAERSPPVKSPAQLRALAILNLVSISYVLFYTFRDLNGAAAILRGLSDPRITRLHRTWELVSVKCKDTFRHLNSMLGISVHSTTGKSPTKTSVSSKSTDAINLVVELLEHHYQGIGAISLIPWLQPFIMEIDDLVAAYTVASGDNGTGVILSDIGQRAVEELFSTLELCKGVGKPDPSSNVGRVAALAVSAAIGGGGRSSGGKEKDLSAAYGFTSSGSGGGGSAAAGLGHPDPGHNAIPPWDRPSAFRIIDLMELPVGDLKILHWVLTRVYFLEAGLWDATFYCEERVVGEVVPALGSSEFVESGVVSPAGTTPGVASTMDATSTGEGANTAESAARAAASALVGGNNTKNDDDEDDWRGGEDDDNEDEGGDVNEKIVINPGILQSALLAGSGGAPAPAGIPMVQTDGTGMILDESNQTDTQNHRDESDNEVDDEEDFKRRMAALESLLVPQHEGEVDKTEDSVTDDVSGAGGGVNGGIVDNDGGENFLTPKEETKLGDDDKVNGSGDDARDANSQVESLIDGMDMDDISEGQGGGGGNGGNGIPLDDVKARGGDGGDGVDDVNGVDKAMSDLARRLAMLRS